MEQPKLVYRGVQRRGQTGVRGATSFSYSLPVAIIWSARPGDVWANRSTKFLDISTILVGQFNAENPLVMGQYSHILMGDVLRLLDFEDKNGISTEEVRKIYNYLHNRITGKAPGGAFAYIVNDSDGEAMDEDDVPLSFSNPMSLISIARDNFEYDPTLEVADDVLADTFIFADSPTVQKVATRLGFDAIVYKDVFEGGKNAAKELLNLDVATLPGVEMEYGTGNKRVPAHWTVRPLTANAVVEIAALPTAEVIQKGLII